MSIRLIYSSAEYPTDIRYRCKSADALEKWVLCVNCLPAITPTVMVLQRYEGAL